MNELKSELAILKSLDHPNIIKLYEIYEDQQYVHLIFEKCNGGDLFDRIILKDGYEEEDAKPIFKTILSAVSHMHASNVAHRDIKPENILFVEDDSNDLKIIDVGLSREFGTT